MFSSLFSNKDTTFGLDIGYDTIKVLQLKKSGNSFFIRSFNTHLLPYNSIDKDGIKNPEELKKIILNVLDESRPSKINSKFVVTSLQESLVFTKIITIPKIKQSDLENSIRYEVSELFPIPVDELYYDWQIINEKIKTSPAKDTIEKTETPKSAETPETPEDLVKKDEDQLDKIEKSETITQKNEETNHSQETEVKLDAKGEKELEVLVTGVPKKIVDEYKSLLDQCGLEISAIETKSISSARAILGPQEKNPILITDIGAESATISIFDNGIIRFTGTINSGGNNVTRTLAGTTILPQNGDDKQKLIQKLDAELNENISEKKKIITKSLLPIINEINQAIKYFLNRLDTKGGISRIIITGGGANIPHIAEIMEEHTGHPVGIANPFTNVRQPKNQSLTSFSSYTTAIGCALRTFMED